MVNERTNEHTHCVVNVHLDRDTVPIRGESGRNGSLVRTLNGADRWRIELNATLRGRSSHVRQECKGGIYGVVADGKLASDVRMGLILYPRVEKRTHLPIRLPKGLFERRVQGLHGTEFFETFKALFVRVLEYIG